MFARLMLLVSLLLLHVAFAANFCGTSFGDASKCQTSCPRGLNGECPGTERCFAGVTCSITSTVATGNYCGTSFGNAVKCQTACPRGLDGECSGLERCFAGVTCSGTPDTQPPTTNGFAGDIVSTTNSEYNTYVGQHECTSPTMAARIGEYWRAIGLSLDGCDRGTPWSAAFVSFMVREAGGGSRFRYSSAHRVYIHDAFSGGRGLYNSVRDIVSSTVTTGDLACSGRSHIRSWDYQDFLNWFNSGGISRDAIPTHCDIVVRVSGGTITVIGGNVDQRVTRATVSKSTYAILLPVTR